LSARAPTGRGDQPDPRQRPPRGPVKWIPPNTRYRDFIPVFRNETPQVFVNPLAFGPELQPTADATAAALEAQGVPADQAQAEAQRVTTEILSALAFIPIGVVSPEQIANDTDVILTYRNFGKLSVNGLDLAFSYYLDRRWTLTGNYSYVTRSGFNPFERPNQVVWRNLDGISDVSLNAPGNKANLTVRYADRGHGLDAELRYRYTEGFPMISGVHVGDLESYTLFDVNVAYELPWSAGTSASLSVSNLLDNRHREFADAPRLGRMVLARVVHTL
jgi:hypothetical protein